MEEAGFFMSGFLEAVSKVGKFALRWDDDIYDRVSHRYTVIILAVFTITVSTKQYVGDPIACWCPAIFTEAMIEYTNHICWISNTYYVPMEQVPSKHGALRMEIIGYYQWIPLMLLLQALLFYMPSLVWAVNNSRPGLDINRMVLLISGIEHINPDIRDKSIRFICRHFDRALAYQREYRKGRIRRCLQKTSKHCCFPIGKVYGNYLTSLYVFVKLLYISNAVGQLYIMNAFLSNKAHNYYLYGINVLGDVYNNKQPETRLFPRVTLCDFKIRQMQNVQDYTVQCALPINIFNEKVYVFLWFHICLVVILSCYGLMNLLWQQFSSNCQTYVSKYLKIMKRIQQQDASLDSRSVRCFVNEYLRPDGVFALRIIAKNTNDVIIAEIISALYEYFMRTSYKYFSKYNSGFGGGINRSSSYLLKTNAHLESCDDRFDV